MAALALVRAAERDHDPRGWVESWRSFPARALAHAGIDSPLFAVAEDIVAPGKGFGRHAHRDMEIVSYVLSGELAHADSTGREGRLAANAIQRMSAGRGIEHSEYNASASESVRFLQIWIHPSERGISPGYEQRGFDAGEPLVALAGDDAGIVRLHQRMTMWRVAASDGSPVALPVQERATAWVHCVAGVVAIDGERLEPGDGAGFALADALTVEAHAASHALVFIAS